MNTLSAAIRVLAAIASVTITLALLQGVFAIAEPQRGQLMAKLHPEQSTVTMTVAMAVIGPARAAK